MRVSRAPITAIVAVSLALSAVARAAVEAPAVEAPSKAPARANYHWVGWFNTFVPGGGQALLGDYSYGAFQAGLETSTFVLGYSLSKRTPLSLDGVPAELPVYQRARRTDLASLDKPLYANMLQEFGIKYHMTNVFDSYRTAARNQGVVEGIDQASTKDLFLAPFDGSNLASPWVWAPLGLIAGLATADYYSSRSGIQRTQPLTPYSNFLFTVHYGLWEPIGSGAPEEMFYRGFLQNEFYGAVPSPYFAIPASAAVFAFSHEPGPGRLTAGIAGLYLGYLAHLNRGDLKPGITLHFWGSVLLGLETLLLSHDAQHATPPGALSVQINF